MRASTHRNSIHHNSIISSRILPDRAAGRIEMIAFYGAFALIAAIVFGTLSVHPF